jgi:BirA family biotin operon repressor/biotin-[acetyl-CoA-carboxylase] ligase
LGKLAGVLAEGGPGYVVVGLGVNVTAAPEVGGDALSARLAAVSLADLGAQGLTPEALVAPVLAHLACLYGKLQDGDVAGFMAAYRALDMTTGQAVTLSLGAECVAGVAEGVADDGALAVRTPQGLRHFTAGEVSLALGA